MPGGRTGERCADWLKFAASRGYILRFAGASDRELKGMDQLRGLAETCEGTNDRLYVGDLFAPVADDVGGGDDKEMRTNVAAFLSQNQPRGRASRAGACGFCGHRLASGEMSGWRMGRGPVCVEVISLFLTCRCGTKRKDVRQSSRVSVLSSKF